MKQSRRNPLGCFSSKLDNSKTAANSTMPSASGQFQASNGVLLQDAVMSFKKEKVGSDAQSGVHAQYVLHLLQLQRQAGFLCDITIHVKDRSFKAHKPLLAACSLYFRALFANDTTKESTALSLTSLTPNGFEVLLDYIYSGSLAITAENSSEVLSAATCLQMTNVVETCLSFMRSSFRMSKHKELSSNSKPDQDEVSNPESVKSLASSEYSLDKIVRQNIVNDTASPSILRSTLRTSPSTQGNLKILETKSINEVEFKNMINQDPDHCGTANTSQIHSSLPLRASTASQSTSSRLLFTSLPSTQRQLTTSSPNVYKFVHELRAKNQLKDSDQTNDSQATVAIQTTSSIVPGQTHLNLPLTSTIASVRSVQDGTSTSSAAANISSPEHHSGIATTARLTSLKDTQNLNDGRDSLTDSSDEQANSVEISSDDEGLHCREWGDDRSATDEPRDLSGTPYPVAVNFPSNSTAVSNDSTSKPAPVAKTKSLPSFSEAKRPTIERARSLDEGSIQTITYENAAKAVSALSRSEWVISAPSDENLGRMPNSEPSENESKLYHDSAEDALSDPVIPSEVLRKTLLPKRRERNVSTPKTTVSHAVQQLDDVCNDDVIKQESNDESEAGAFPLSKDATEKAFKIANEQAMTDDNNALDLSVPKRLSRPNSIQTDESVKGSSRHSSEVSNLSDPGMALAVDALSLLRHSKSSETTWPTVTDMQTMSLANAPQSYETSDNFLEEANHWNQQGSSGANVSPWKQAAYSRKPRRTAGGQTCTWPGCGRLFRHRNIYEEHQRLHELGIPVSQLRKCYMGARVKKTVREQLEELRTNDNVFEGSGDRDSTSLSRVRKRKSMSDSQEPLRKRVHVKDRAAPLHLLHPSGSTSASRSPVSAPHARIRHSLSHPFNSSPQSSFLRAPLPPPLIPNSKLMKVVGTDGLARFAARPEHLAGSSPRAASSSLAATLPLAQSSIQPSPTTRVPGSSASNATQQFAVNPVQQTLALLGIRTPMRQTESGDYLIPMSNIPDQMRRRMAIRETTAVGPRLESASTNHTVLSVPPPTFDPDAVRARLVLPGDGYQILSHGSGSSRGGSIQLPHNQPHPGPSSMSG